MSEMLERVHEFQRALNRYLENNDIRNAGGPLVGALFDLKTEMASLQLPYPIARFEILPEAPIEFFLENWGEPHVTGGGVSILLPKKYFPISAVQKYEEKLYLQVAEYTVGMERKINVLRDQSFLKPVDREYGKNSLQNLNVSGKNCLQDLLLTHVNKQDTMS